MAPIVPSFIEKLNFDEKDLIPAIAQDWLDGAVLMMAWMNRQSLDLTLQTGEIHYWSRSRKEIWHKGATSGHFQKLKGIRYDCDSDAILLSIEQIGSIACHQGKRSCFFHKINLDSSNEFISSFPPSSSELTTIVCPSSAPWATLAPGVFVERADIAVTNVSTASFTSLRFSADFSF